MENSEIIDEQISDLFIIADFKDEDDDYDETEDEYDLNNEDSYDDGIAKTSIDDFEDDAFYEDSEEIDSETAPASSIKEELEDSIEESEDYDELDD